MADKNNKVEGNAPGAYYVDTNCTACGICIDEAPDHFDMSDDGGSALVIKQPSTDDEKANCENALEACPSEAIGNNG